MRFGDCSRLSLTYFLNREVEGLLLGEAGTGTDTRMGHLYQLKNYQELSTKTTARHHRFQHFKKMP